MLKSRVVIKDLPFHRVDYCCYGMPYRKRTRIWGEFPAKWKPREMCNGRCGFVVGGRHKGVAQWGDGWSVHELHAMPRALCDEIADACNDRPARQKELSDASLAASRLDLTPLARDASFLPHTMQSWV